MNDSYNYVVLANKIDRQFLNNFSEYPEIGELPYEELTKKLEFHPARRIVFNNTFYNLREKEIKKIMELLNSQNIKFILITSDVECSLYGDYIYVYDGYQKVLEGLKETVLKEEKVLKKIGYGLPFVVDLALQLNYYDIFDKIYWNMDDLVRDLWS